jgi:hypothetical protein
MLIKLSLEYLRIKSSGCPRIHKAQVLRAARAV